MTASLALLRVHVLVLELPGWPVLRLRALAAVRARGWVPVGEPADADLVLVCGVPRPEVVEAVDGIWRHVPAPRVRRTVRTAEALPEALDSAMRVLADVDLQRRSRRGPVVADGPAAAGPAEAARRAGAADPQTVRFGPVGPDWPAGLLLECTVGAGGRIVAVGARRLGSTAGRPTAPELAVVLAVADAARLLRIAGWSAPALRLDRVVDLALGGTPRDRVRRRLRAVAALVRRSATLRWAAGDAVPARILALLGSAIDGTMPPAPEERVLIGARPADVPILAALTEPVHG